MESLDEIISDHSEVPDSPFEVAAAPARRRSDDGSLMALLVTAPHAAASIASKNANAASAVEGVVDIFMAEDLGDSNRQIPMRPDELLLAESSVSFYGQPVAVIVAENESAAAKAADALEIDYHPSQSILDVEHALAMKSFSGEARSISRGDSEKALLDASFRLGGSLEIGSQLPWPRETLEARVSPGTAGFEVWIPSEIPSRVRAAVSATIGIPESRIQIHPEKLTGSPGGRQSEGAWIAALTALAARRTGRTVTLRLDRESDAILSAKRHAVQATFSAGFDHDGRIAATDIRFFIDGGHSPGDSDASLDQLLLHADASYFVADFKVTAQLCRTNRITGSSLPGEGIVQAAVVMEEIVTRIANRLGLPPEQVRSLNFYREEGNRHSTHFGQPVNGDQLDRLWRDAVISAQLKSRREEIAQWNQTNPCYKRGIAAVPLKAGISDPRSDRNQAMALVQLLVDGSLTIRLGCVDSGAGLPERIAEEAARQFGINPGEIVVRCGDLNCTPHMTPHIGVDSVGLLRRAVADACSQLKERLQPVAAQLLAAGGVTEVDAESVRFTGNSVSAGSQSRVALPFAEVVDAAWRRRANMSAIGFYRTPNLWWDPEVGAGWPFSGFVFGAAVIEVQLDAFTGEVQILQADVYHPGGRATQMESDRAQISRALSLGFGWMLNETVRWDENGALGSASSDQYTIPGYSDAPLRLNLDVIPSRNDPAEDLAASGAESAVVLANAAREAVREAIRSFGVGQNRDVEVELPIPAPPEAVLRALRDMSRKLAEAQQEE